MALKQVVLPALFGPIRPRIRRAGYRTTHRSAPRSPPNSTVRVTYLQQGVALGGGDVALRCDGFGNQLGIGERRVDRRRVDDRRGFRVGEDACDLCSVGASVIRGFAVSRRRQPTWFPEFARQPCRGWAGVRGPDRREGGVSRRDLLLS